MKKALLLKTAIVCSVCASVLILVICSCNRYDFIPVAYGDLVFIDGMALYQGEIKQVTIKNAVNDYCEGEII